MFETSNQIEQLGHSHKPVNAEHEKPNMSRRKEDKLVDYFDTETGVFL